MQNTNTSADTKLPYRSAKHSLKAGIKLKLLSVLLPIVICIIMIIIFSIYRSTSEIIVKKSETILQTSTESVVNKVTAWMNETITALNMERDTMQYFGLTGADELNYIKHTVNQYESFPAGIYAATTEGDLIHASFTPGPEYDVFEKSWYIDGLKSEKFIFGSVYFDEDSQSYVVGASGMLKNQAGQIRGVAAADIYLDAISHIVQEVQIEQTGAMFLVDTITDTIIGHKDPAIVGTLLSDQKDPMYQYVSGLVKDETFGLAQCTDEIGNAVYLQVQQVPESSWVTVAYVPHAEIIADLNALTANIAFISFAGILILIILMERFIHLIVKPIRKLTHTIGAMTAGDFTADIHVHTKDEIGLMAEGIHKFISVMHHTLTVINDITTGLNQQSSDSSQVAENLSAASGLQSESMNEMNRTVDDLTASITDVAENAGSLSLLVADTRDRGAEAGEQMAEAVAASKTGKDNMDSILLSMHEISQKISVLEKSAANMEGSIVQINSIVELIRDIAEETNLLSLNASIEAARAGEAGRGFAVVADQIGKLALNSRNAVDDISNLTQTISGLVEQTVSETRDSAHAIHASSDIIDHTGTVFNTIYDAIRKTDASVSVMIEKVQTANEIATNVAGITQQQSAASEEILATTETMRENAHKVLDNSISVASNASSLKDNAQNLKQQLDLFKL